MGRMLSAGRLKATITSEKTGTHITVEFVSKVKVNNRWQNSEFADATHVFISGGQGNKLGTFYPQKGNLYFTTEDRAWKYAVQQILGAATRIQQDLDGVYRIEESSHCGRCGLELTDPVSIARGLGPHCADMDTGSHHYKAEAAPKEEAEECQGHESTDGPIGNVVYCDGSCIKGHPVFAALSEEAREVIAVNHTDRKGREIPRTFAELAGRLS